MDTITIEQRKLNMSHIRSGNTTPEMVVRKILWRLGYKYRLHIKKLPGKPDIYISRIKTVIFVHGCFWHQHEKCKRQSMPKSRIDYWRPKLKKNIERFAQQSSLLNDMRINVIVIWECQTKDKEKLQDSIQLEMQRLEKKQIVTSY